MFSECQLCCIAPTTHYMNEICAMSSQDDASLLPIASFAAARPGWHPKQACPLQLLKAPSLSIFPVGLLKDAVPAEGRNGYRSSVQD